MQKIGFMGLGAMGGRMARHLLAHKCVLNVYNRTQSKAQPLVDAGAELAQTPREAAEGADFVFSMIDTDDTSRALWLGKDGALAGAKPGAVLIECSTLSPSWIEELLGHAAEKKCHLLDAPVGGTIGPAEQGELLFMAGGDPEILERARPVIEPMARATVHVGPSGSGAKIKLIHNMMMAAQVANLAEALLLAQRASLDVAKVTEVVTNGAPNSRIVSLSAPLMASGDYGETQFSLKLLSKDVDYALQMAEDLGIEMGIARQTGEYYRTATAEGLGERQFAAVMESLKNNSRRNAHVQSS